MTINFNNNKAYSGHNGALSGRRGSDGSGGGGGGCAPVVGTEIEISGELRTSYDIPIYGYNDYSMSAHLYDAALFTAQTEYQMTGIYWAPRSYSTPHVYTNLKVYIGYVQETGFDSSPNTDLSDLTLTGFTEVYNAQYTVSANSSGGVPNAYIPFSTNFCYNVNNGNLILKFLYDVGTWSGSGYGRGYYSSTSGYTSMIAASDVSLPATGSRTNKRLNVRFEY